jgi:ParB-like chromosome segregation protein Spo0J
MAKQKVEYVNPMALNPDTGNPRKITPEKFARLKRGIEKFGLDAQPIVARREGSRIIGGHQRLAAAQSLGMNSVPVIFMDISDKDAKALNVLLNNEEAQ